MTVMLAFQLCFSSPCHRSDEDRLALQMAMHLGWPSDGHFPIGSGVLGLGIAVGGRKEGDVQEIPVLLKASGRVRTSTSTRVRES